MKTKVLKVRGDKFCQLEVELRGEDPEVGPELSVCGTSGTIVTADEAVNSAISHWESFFDESSEEIGSMVSRFPSEMADYLGEYGDASTAAAHFVVDTDGCYHGLDVFLDYDCKVYLTESCGQIRDELRVWFPEHAKHFKHHLNHMHAGCEHQEVLGWGRGHDVHLARDGCTPAQLEALDARLMREVVEKREKYIDTVLLRIQTAQRKMENPRAITTELYWLLKQAGYAPTISDVEAMTGFHKIWSLKSFLSGAGSPLHKKVIECLDQSAKLEHPDRRFTVQSFKDSIGAPCPECGYCYGRSWLKRKLPEATLTWAKNLKSATIMEDCDEEDEEDEG